MTSIFLIRHGETEWNRLQRVQGLTDIPLNETGRSQAREAAAALEALAMRWDGVFASPLSRAAETADIIRRHIGAPSPLLLPEVVERNYGEAEGLDGVEITRRYGVGVEPPGREPVASVASRMSQALLKMFTEHEEKNLILVSHGGVMRVVLQMITGGVFPAKGEPIVNAGIHEIVREGDTVRYQDFEPVSFDLFQEHILAGKE